MMKMSNKHAAGIKLLFNYPVEPLVEVIYRFWIATITPTSGTPVTGAVMPQRAAQRSSPRRTRET